MLRILVVLVFIILLSNLVGSSDTPSVCFLILYFGRLWPPLFSPFLLGALRSSDKETNIDVSLNFKIISNMESLPIDLPDGTSNIQFQYLSFATLNAMLVERLDMDPRRPISASNAYKLVDFKTMLGYLFADELHGYDFWGHIDADTLPSLLVSPDFISRELLNSADVISATNGMCNGPLQLYRNINKVNTLFMHSKDLSLVVNTSKNLGFTENHGIMKAPFPIVLRKNVIKHRVKWNRTRVIYLEDRSYFRSGAESGFVWNPKFHLRLIWNDSGLFEQRISDDRSYAIDVQQVQGFFHFISWKYLDSFRSLDNEALTHLQQSTSSGRNVIISCHGMYKSNEQTLQASLEQCNFEKKVGHFYRWGRKPACLGGANANDAMLRFAAKSKPKQHNRKISEKVEEEQRR